MAFGGVFHPTFRPVFDPAGVVAVPPAADWWTAGSAPTPVAVYQPKGAASLAASYSNLVNPGTYDAYPGTAPSWASGTGWTFNGSTQYLIAGVAAPLNGSLLVRYSNGGQTGGQTVVGSSGGGYHALGSYWYGDAIYYGNGGAEAAAAPKLLTGVLAFADNRVYRDGVDSHEISGWRVAGVVAYFIGAYASSGGEPNFWFEGNVLAVAIWDTSTGHATWMPAVMAAVALI